MIFGRCKLLKEWSDWENSIHESEAQISRQGRAMTYPFDFSIKRKNQTAKFSSTSDLPYYNTSLSSCTCGDFEERQLPCKHIYRLAVELGIIEIIKRKSGNWDKSKLDEIKKSDNIDNDPEQLKRQKSAMTKKCNPVELDKINKTGIFKGSGKAPYITTLDSCTCRDFVVRNLPCKHIYRLRIELGESQAIAPLDNSLTREEAKAIFDELTEQEMSLFLGVGSSDKWTFENKEELQPLFERKMLVVCNDFIVYLDRLKKADLQSMLDNENINYKKGCKKSELIDLITSTFTKEQADDFISTQPVAVNLTDDFSKHYNALKVLYHKKHPYQPKEYFDEFGRYIGE